MQVKILSKAVDIDLREYQPKPMPCPSCGQGITAWTLLTDAASRWRCGGCGARGVSNEIGVEAIDWFQNGVITYTTGPKSAIAAMRMTSDNGYSGYQVFDSDGTLVSHVAWVDDTKQELACYEWPYRIVGAELAMVIKQVNGVRVDHMNKAIHVNTGVALTIQSKACGQIGHSQPKACTECRQEETCRRISYCAQYRCGFGEVDKP